jgi:hypothetical protein
MKTMSRVLGVLVFAGWAGSVSAERITDAGANTVDGLARANAGVGQEGVEQPRVISNTGQMAGRVFINPQTGKLVGPPAGVEPPGLSVATQNKLSRSDRGLKMRRLPNGTMQMDLQGRFQNMSVVTLDQEGEAHVTCSHSLDNTEKALAHSADMPTVQEGREP